MLMQIVSHTPTWVFALFAGLLWLGGRQMMARRMKLSRITLVALLMTGLSVAGVWSAFHATPVALLAWALAAALATALVVRRPLPQGLRYDTASRECLVPGSAVPLMLMMGIFVTKYVVGVLVAMQPAMAQQLGFASAMSAAYGVFSGVFVGRAMRLWQLALRMNRETGLQAA
ncbi:DUF6622 family protein [Ideonella sp.]